MLCLILLPAACAASSGPGFPSCKAGGWQECVPVKAHSGMMATTVSWKYACAMCKVQNESVASGGPFPFLAKAEGVAVRGYPFHVLSAESLAPLEHSVVRSLALIDAEITDVENNTFAGFSILFKLSLDSNRLTSVKRAWSTGLEKLFQLVLSNNNIKQIEPGAFVRLTHLYLLDLENNLLQVVDPAWLFRLKGIKILFLGSNAINSISPGSFKHLQLTLLDLTSTGLSCLDGEVLLGQSSLARLSISSDVLSSVHDARPHGMMWSLYQVTNVYRGSVTMVVWVPKLIFCVRHNAYGFSFGWMFASSNNVPLNMVGVTPGNSCGVFDRSLRMISIQAPVVVLATDGSQADKLVPNTLEQCMEVWEYASGITVGPVGSSIFRLASMTEGNASFEGVAMSFSQTKDTTTLTTYEPGYNQRHATPTNTFRDNTQNITCILLTKDEHTELFFTAPQVQGHTHTTPTPYRTDTESSRLTHYTSSEPGDNSTLRMSTTTGSEMPPATDHVVIPVVVSAVLSLVVSSLAVLAWMSSSPGLNTEDESDDAHVWTIPPGVAFPGLLRSASLPACSSKMASDDAASCRSLPAVLHSIEPAYSGIPDDIAAAHRPLPGLPHTYWEIPDDDISDLVRSSSLPAVSCTRKGAPDDATSCRSLPAVLMSIEPTYSLIPDRIAAAQRPLPALPRISWETADRNTAAQRPLSAPRHTYSEIPDDESGPMPFYADAAEHHIPRRSSLATLPNTYWPWEISGDGTRITPRRASLPLVTLPNTYWPWEMTGQGARNTPRRSSLATLPNTYWPWEIGEGPRNTPRRSSLSTLPNTYWPWEISTGERTRNTPRRVSLPLVTPPNTYWPWEIGEGPSNTPRRSSLSTLPNTYWPWEISTGERTRNTPRRVSLPLVTPPNTYWPWEIGEGPSNTPRRSSLSTLPNTYWPWEISTGERTRNTPRRASLLSHHLTPTGHGRLGRDLVTHHGARPFPHCLTPTGHGRSDREGTRNTPRRSSPWSHHLTPTGHGRLGRDLVTHHGARPFPHCLTPTGHGRFCRGGNP
uniref:LRRCT domain-containing protein n=1 Tax=Branchiostoma floridae TaxID=7739 RepID=C3YWJ4_BRAFL|eukprot:XP_002599226.1 hypothetical protein BRAFLDRAFT_64425 [Branchiostoma floridae]